MISTVVIHPKNGKVLPTGSAVFEGEKSLHYRLNVYSKRLKQNKGKSQKKT